MKFKSLKHFFIWQFLNSTTEINITMIQTIYYTLDKLKIFSFSDLKYYVTNIFFFDNVYTKKQITFYKLGANLDSLIKSIIVFILKKTLVVCLVVFDKYTVSYMTKTTTENMWTTLFGLFNKTRRNYLSIFKYFWYFLFFSLFFMLLV